MTHKALISVILSCLVLLCSSSCNTFRTSNLDNTAQEAEKNLFAMNTYMTLKAYGSNGKEAIEKSAERIQQIEALVSVTNNKSEIYKLNNSDKTDIPLSTDTFNLLKSSLQINRETDGAFNITLYPISCEWGFTTGKYKIPSKDTISELLSYADCNNIVFNEDTHTASLKEKTKVDFGGIAKGYAGSEAAKLIKNYGVSSAILNMGGNVQAVGLKPDGIRWKVGIRDPENNDLLVGTVEVEDKAVITSGGYERYFKGDDGNIYWHIIDPKTGYPSKSGIISVTVIGNDGTFCDALSTSLFVMKLDEAAIFLKAHQEFDAVIITDDNKLYITPGVKNSFNPSGNYKNTFLNNLY